MRLLYLLMVLAGHVSFAQFNDSTNHYINYASTGIINKTNDGNSYVLNNSVKFNIYKKNYSLNTTNVWIYGENAENLTNNDFSSVIDFNLFKSDRHIYYWALVNYEKSFSLKIDNRIQAGAGIGYYIIDKENFVLQLSDGLLYERSELFDAEQNKFGNEILRNSFRLKFRFVINETITFENSDFIQHSLSDHRDYILRSTTSLSVRLLKWLSFNVSLDYNKLSATDRENLIGNVGLRIERYF